MRFQVPQFIEVEDKIFGPLTFKQFIYLGGGGGLSVVFYMLLPKFISFLLILPVVAFSLALAFYKVNNKPFINVVEAFFKYVVGGKLYIWKKQPKKAVAKAVETPAYSQVYVPKLGDSKLKDLTWSLDVRESVNPVTPNSGEQSKTPQA
ncbi:MAG TPA: PrgI family protein [Candidatus Paceibacterota bacterium]|jgi:hypothetical protein|nr:PrgI family protein [Candidatus Paceibacterota bacterium]